MPYFVPEPHEITTTGVAAAWRKAAALRGRSGGDFHIGILKGERLIARGTLPSYEQLVFFSLEMTRLGFRARPGDRKQPAFRCDFLFCNAAQRAER